MGSNPEALFTDHRGFAATGSRDISQFQTSAVPSTQPPTATLDAGNVTAPATTYEFLVKFTGQPRRGRREPGRCCGAGGHPGEPHDSGDPGVVDFDRPIPSASGDAPEADLLTSAVYATGSNAVA